MKNLSQRIKEVSELYKQLNKIGMDERFEEIQEFRKIANEYVKSGKPVQGFIPMKNIQRILCYSLTNKQKEACNILLKYQED